MSKDCREKKHLREKNILDWGRAIADAKERIKRLEFSIRIFRQRKKAGEKWPAESARQV